MFTASSLTPKIAPKGLLACLILSLALILPSTSLVFSEDIDQTSVYPINWQHIKSDWIWIYAGHLMTDDEKWEYMNNYRNLKTDHERAVYKEQHRRWMKLRVENPDLPHIYSRDFQQLELWKKHFNRLRNVKNDSRWIFGGHLMTKNEKKEYQKKYREMETVEDRLDLRDHHRFIILERAKVMDPQLWNRYEESENS